MAKKLGVSIATVRAWTGQHRLKHYKLGRRIVFDRSDIEAFEELNCVEAIDVEK